MHRTIRHLTAALVLVPLPALLAAQELITPRPGIVSLYAGGYTPLTHLDPAGMTDFSNGFNAGASLGVQLTPHVGVHADFTFARARARGMAPFAGEMFNHYFYGAHLEIRKPPANGAAPYGFVGLGAVTIAGAGSSSAIRTFTRPAAMFGLGLFLDLPHSNIQVFGEGKGMVYSWSAAGYQETQWDVLYALGLSYRFKV